MDNNEFTPRELLEIARGQVASINTIRVEYQTTVSYTSTREEAVGRQVEGYKRRLKESPESFTPDERAVVERNIQEFESGSHSPLATLESFSATFAKADNHRFYSVTSKEGGQDYLRVVSTDGHTNKNLSGRIYGVLEGYVGPNKASIGGFAGRVPPFVVPKEDGGLLDVKETPLDAVLKTEPTTLDLAPLSEEERGKGVRRFIHSFVEPTPVMYAETEGTFHLTNVYSTEVVVDLSKNGAIVEARQELEQIWPDDWPGPEFLRERGIIWEYECSAFKETDGVYYPTDYEFREFSGTSLSEPLELTSIASTKVNVALVNRPLEADQVTLDFAKYPHGVAVEDADLGTIYTVNLDSPE